MTWINIEDNLLIKKSYTDISFILILRLILSLLVYNLPADRCS